MVQAKYSNLVELLSNTKSDGECLVWLGPFLKKGSYGRNSYQSHPIRTHRLSLAFSMGIFDPKEIKKIGNVLHSCDNPPCINPNHLRIGTHKENMQECSERGRRPRGTEASSSKITESQARRVKQMIQDGYKVRTIVQEVGITRHNVYNIKKNRGWNWLEV